MTKPSWKPDERARADAVRALDDALESRATQAPLGDVDRLARALRTMGTLVVLDATGATAPAKLEGLKRAGRAALIAVLEREAMCDALEDSAIRLRDALAIDSDDDRYASLANDAAAALEVRDHAELELLGAAFLLGCSPEALEASSSSRRVFDEVVRPESWRLVAVNELRQAMLATLSPRVRARFWWWQAGAGLAASAISAMSVAAELVARFPNARRRFESLVRAQAAWTSAGLAATASPRRTVRTWLVRAEARDLLLAAAADDEVLVMETPELELSFAAPARLVIDLLADRRPAALPWLRGSSGLVVGATSVANTNERFAFELPDAILDDRRVSLVVPLASGDHELVLPGPDRDDA